MGGKNILSNHCKYIEHKSQTFRRTHLGLHAGLYNTSENHWIKSSSLVESACLACRFYLSCAQSEEGQHHLGTQRITSAESSFYPPPTESTNSGGGAQQSVNEPALQGIFIHTEVWESLPKPICLYNPNSHFLRVPNSIYFRPTPAIANIHCTLSCITDCAKYHVLGATL